MEAACGPSSVRSKASLGQIIYWIFAGLGRYNNQREEMQFRNGLP